MISESKSGYTIDVPLDADDEDKLGLLLDVHAAVLSSSDSSKSDLLTLGISVLLDVGLGSLEDGFALLLVCLE